MGRRINSISPEMPQNQSQEVAQQVSSSNQLYKTENSFDVFQLASSLQNVELQIIPLDDNLSGYIEKIDNKYIIAINNKHSSLRQRFTLAHELGHYYLHQEKLADRHTDVKLFRDANEDRLGLEYAANDFAAELLMPAETFKSAIKSGQNTPKTLSTLFQVTEKAVLYRAYKLGIIKSFLP